MAKKMKKLFSLVLALSMVMSLMSVAASAAESEYKCGMAAHTHGDGCYTTSTICGKHTHDGCEEGCTVPVGQDLVCQTEEHEHKAECHPLKCDEKFDCDKEYDCAISEDHDHAVSGCATHTCVAGTCTDHTHSDSCYDMDAAVSCGKDEHDHEAAGSDCYKDHVHVGTCYKTELTCNDAEHTHTSGCAYGLGVVAIIGDATFTTLKGAVDAANANEGADVIELVDNTIADKAMTITENVTISGNYTITRAVTGTMITVNAGKTLTLDGGIVIDGDNNWTFDSVNYYADMAARKTLSTGAKNSYTASEEGGLVATNAMFTVKGAVVMNNAAIQNNWGSTLFSIPAADAALTMNAGTKIQHIHGWVVSKGSSEGLKGTWTMNGGKIDDVYGHNTNGALVDIRGGTFTINGGEITNVRTLGLNANGNGLVAQVFGENSKLNINGGYIHGNASFAPGNGWGAVVYLNRGGDFTMTGGTIKDNITDKCTAFVSNAPTKIDLLGGTIEVDPSTGTSFHSLFDGDVTVAEGMKIIGTADALTVFLDEGGNKLDIDGNISGGTIWLMFNEPVTGSGTITSDVLVKAYSYYGHDGKVTIAEGNWLDSVITVDAVDAPASLTVKPAAKIAGKQVRVLDSVASGDYTNATEAAAAQAAAYVKEAGATVESPVLYYHRLTSAQKSNIVVTFDYNGGLDAQGWSGVQLTGEEAFAPALPTPTKAGLKLAGWKYAVDNNPECLTMEGAEDYVEGTPVTTLRLIAQWEEVKPVVRPKPSVDNGGEEIEDPDVPMEEAPVEEETEFEEPEVPTTDAPEVEELGDEEVPLADVPATGDMTLVWAAASAVSAAGLFLISKKSKDEE